MRQGEKQLNHVYYPVCIGRDLQSKMVVDLGKRYSQRRLVIVTDLTVRRLYGLSLQRRLRQAGMTVDLLSFPAGERFKNLTTLGSLAQQLQHKQADRQSVILALGGGVVGDLAGYLAASYMRGVSLVQIPTTLLAQTTSAIGGKVGLDIPGGKNYLGVFKQPDAVYMQTAYLKTLPRREVRTGLAEVIGYGVFADRKLFAVIECRLADLLRLEPAITERVVRRCVALKLQIVAGDVEDHTARHVLNYGHTIGHALEQLTRYEQFTHGEAIAIGAQVAARLSALLGYLSVAEEQRHRQVYQAAGLPLTVPRVISTAALLRVVQQDKKARAGATPFILLRRIGQVVDARGTIVPSATLAKAIDQCRV